MILEELEKILKLIEEVQNDPMCVGHPDLSMALFQSDIHISDAIKLAKEMKVNE
jgi:hypothetical protein